jgi:catechol 2,3-dioxygenase-like lactoylglutathione lyase family enzyme
LSIDVERVDYIRVPVKDIEEAKHFYGELLGLSLNANSPGDDWLEFEAGNVTLAAAGVQVNDMWDSGKCRGAGVHDPSGNPILLHRRYAPYPDGSTP